MGPSGCTPCGGYAAHPTLGVHLPLFRRRALSLLSLLSLRTHLNAPEQSGGRRAITTDSARQTNKKPTVTHMGHWQVASFGGVRHAYIRLWGRDSPRPVELSSTLGSGRRDPHQRPSMVARAGGVSSRRREVKALRAAANLRRKAEANQRSGAEEQQTINQCSNRIHSPATSRVARVC